MIDQSHNVEGKIDAMLQSVMNIQTAYAKALLVDEDRLAAAQRRGRRARGPPNPLEAFETDVRPLLARLPQRARPAEDPVAAFREGGFAERRAAERGIAAVESAYERASRRACASLSSSRAWATPCSRRWGSRRSGFSSGSATRSSSPRGRRAADSCTSTRATSARRSGSPAASSTSFAAPRPWSRRRRPASRWCATSIPRCPRGGRRRARARDRGARASGLRAVGAAHGPPRPRRTSVRRSPRA